MYANTITILAVMAMLTITPMCGADMHVEDIHGDGITAINISTDYGYFNVVNSYILANVSEGVFLCGSNNIVRATGGMPGFFVMSGHNNGIVTDASYITVEGRNNIIYATNESITHVTFVSRGDNDNNIVYIMPNATLLRGSGIPFGNGNGSPFECGNRLEVIGG